jgi:hypothetical protein
MFIRDRHIFSLIWRGDGSSLLGLGVWWVCGYSVPVGKLLECDALVWTAYNTRSTHAERIRRERGQETTESRTSSSGSARDLTLIRPTIFSIDNDNSGTAGTPFKNVEGVVDLVFRLHGGWQVEGGLAAQMKAVQIPRVCSGARFEGSLAPSR